jgi:hypothetical protein
VPDSALQKGHKKGKEKKKKGPGRNSPGNIPPGPTTLSTAVIYEYLWGHVRPSCKLLKLKQEGHEKTLYSRAY